MRVSFTSHNIRLDDGSFTKPDVGFSMDVHPWFLAAKRILDAAFPGDKRHLRIADLGCENEGLPGRWLPEFRSQRAFLDRENRRWASWNNEQSFWIQREYILQALRDAGFDLVLEQFDGLGPNIAFEMTREAIGLPDAAPSSASRLRMHPMPQRRRCRWDFANLRHRNAS